MIFRTSLRSSEVRCEVQKFISKFTSQFVNKGCDWLLNSMKPIKCLVYKRIVKFEFRNELLNFATNSRTSQRSSKSYSEKEFSSKRVSYRGAASWNKLPSEMIREVVKCQSVDSLHRILKDYVNL